MTSLCCGFHAAVGGDTILGLVQEEIGKIYDHDGGDAKQPFRASRILSMECLTTNPCHYFYIGDIGTADENEKQV